MNCNCPVNGVGGWFDGIGSFFESGLGEGLLTAGLSIGTGLALRELDLGPSRSGQPTGGTYVNPASSGFNPLTGQPQPIIIQQPQTTPSWVLPAAVGVGVLALALVLRR